MRAPTIYYTAVALIRQYVKGVQKTEIDFSCQCPFSADLVLEKHYREEVKSVAQSMQELPLPDVKFSETKTNEIMVGFTSYVDFSSEAHRTIRGSVFAFDVRETLS
jgi:hypothetical protein